MHVLVTGCCGYLGSSLVPRLLAEGHEVTGVDNLEGGAPLTLLAWLYHPRFSFLRQDVLGLAVSGPLTRADVIVHLAGVVGAPLCERFPERAWKINAVATGRLVGLLSPRQKILYAMTNSGYGTTSGKEECTEESPLEPISIYGRSKVEGEKAVLDHPGGVSLRLATVFGTSARMRFDLLVHSFVRALILEGKLTLYEPGFVRSLIHLQDVCGAFLHHLEPRGAGVWNVASPTDNLSKGDLARRICQILGLDPEGIQVGAGVDPDQRNYRVSSARLLASGFTFRHTLEEGVQSVAVACRCLPRPLLESLGHG